MIQGVIKDHFISKSIMKLKSLVTKTCQAAIIFQ
jgi:hypothetical protein